MMLRTIADHLLDIAQNSIDAGAKNVTVSIEEDDKTFKFTVRDDGRGMDETELSRVFDPFFSSRDPRIRRVGLGLPFLKESAELTGGYVKITSKKGKGTTVEVLFRKDSIDCPPVGNIAETVATLLFSGDGMRWKIVRVKNGTTLYDIDSRELELRYGDLMRTPSFMKAVLESLEEIESGSTG